MLKLLLTAITLIGMLAAPVLAQEDDAAEGEDMGVPIDFQGIAVAQAPEAGIGVCFGPDSAATIKCAEDACTAASGLGLPDCAAQLWCYPHAWVADISVLHVEGIGWREFVCGKNSREALDKAIAATCDDETLSECKAIRIWDPDGEEMLGQVQEPVTVLD